MANREQIWTIVADFSSLTKQSRQAARAINALDKARNDANRNVNRTTVNDREISQLDKLTASLREATKARRADTASLRTSAQAQQVSTIATTRASTARKADSDSMRSHASASADYARNIGVAANATKASSAALNKHSRESNKAARASRVASNAARDSSRGFSFLRKAIEDTIPSSRSFGLIMKMLPLTALTSAFNSLAPAIAGVGGAFVGLAGTLGPVLGLLGAMPTMLTAILGSIGGVVAGISGIGGAFSKYRKMQQAQDKAAIKSTKTSASSEKARQKSIRTTSRSLEKARRDQVRAAEDIREAQERVAETAIDNARSIKSAEKTVATAQLDAKKAQLAVNEARRDAAKSLEEYKSKLRGAVHDEESAVLDLERARGALARAMADPGSTDLERRAADLSVREAELRLEDIRKANVSLAKDVEKAQAKGVEGSDEVRQAKEAEAQAHEAVVEAQDGLKQAYADADKATRSAKRSLESANQAYSDGGERIAELSEELEELKAGTDAAAVAAEGAATQTAEYEAALAKLSPAAREVVKELIKYSEAWEKIAARSSEAMSPGLLSFLQNLRVKLLPDIADFLVRMAGGAGDFLKSLGELLTTKKSISAFGEIFEDSYDFMKLLGEATLNVTEWLLGLGVAARRSGLTKWIGQTVKNWTESWKKAVDTPEALENTIEGFKDAITYSELWGRALRDTWRFLRTFFRGFRPLGTAMVESISEVTKRWTAWTESDAGEKKLKVWQELAAINLSGLANTIRTITAQGVKLFDGIDFQRVWDALNGSVKGGGLINALGDLLGIVSEDMVVTIIDLGTAIAGILKPIGESGAMNAVIAFVKTMAGFADVVSTLLREIPGLSVAVAGLIGVFASKKIMVGLGNLLGLPPVFKAIDAAKAKGYSGVGLAGAATKEYMGYGNMVMSTDSPEYVAAQDARNKRKDTKRLNSGKKTMTSAEYQAFAYGPDSTARDLAAQQKQMKEATKSAGVYRKSVQGISRAWGAVSGAMKGTVILLAISAAIGLIDKLTDQMVTAKRTSGEVATAITRDLNGVGSNKALTTIFSDFEITMQDAALGIPRTTKGISGALKLLQYDSENSFRAWAQNWDSFGSYGKQVDAVKETLSLFSQELSNLPLDQATSQFRDFASQAETNGWSMERINDALPEYRDRMAQAAAQVGINTEDTDALNQVLKGTHPEQKKINRAFEEGLDPAEKIAENQKTLTERLEDTTQKIKDQKDKLKAWNDEVRNAVGSVRSIEEARDALQSTINDVTENIAGKNLEGTSDEAISNREGYRRWADDINAVAESMINAGTPIQDVNKYLADQRSALQKSANEFYDNNTKAGAFVDTLGLFPDYVAVDVLVATKNLTIDQISELEKTISIFPESVQSEIRFKAQTDGYNEAVEMRKALEKEIGIKVSFVNGDTGISTVDQTGSSTSIYFPKSGLVQKAAGGPVFGPGTNTSDSIPALLSNEEYVIKAKSAKAIGYSDLDYINRNGKLPGYANGGKVQKYASGGKVSGSGLGGFFGAFRAIGSAFTNLGVGVANWGSGYSTWWNSLWGILATRAITGTRAIVASVGTMNTSVAGQLGSTWAATWTRALTVVSSNITRMVGMVTSGSTGMTRAWTTLMDTMKVPVSNGIKFINNTLGTLVNKVSSYYGVKGSPFPVSVPGFDGGGYTGPGARLQPAGIVHADEFVIKKSSRRNIEKNSPGLLDHMNKTGQVPGYAVGGRVRPSTGAESGSYRGHSGIDYRVPIGTPVRAADSGVISSTPRLNRSYGWHIVQALTGGLRAIYAHLSGFSVRPGQAVSAGQVIGRSGNTGNSTGPHLHFEVTGAGGAGSAANREFTRRWLGGAAGIAGGTAEAISSALSPEVANASVRAANSAVAAFKASHDTGWGAVVSGVVSNIAGGLTQKMKSATEGLTGALHEVLTPISSATGDSSKVRYKGGTFSSRFAAVLQAAEKLSGSSFNISQGGFRPATKASGTSHAGDAVDIAGPVNARVVNALRRSGVAAWDRTGKGAWGPHIHGVPLPGYGYGAGSAIWQAQDYLRGGDGLGSKRLSASTSKKMYARGGWTGPGRKYTPAGIVHADEYVINKSSRQNIERTAPGLLDHMNQTGTLPGYASGGNVASIGKGKGKGKTQANMEASLRKYTVYLSYLRKAQEYDASVSPSKTLPETRRHTKILETLLHWEGLLGSRSIDGHFGTGEAAAIKKLQKSYGFAQTGKIDYATYKKLLDKYKVRYNSIYNYSPGFDQPTIAQSIISSQISSNKVSDAFFGYLGKIKGWGFTKVWDKLKALGPDGVPEEYRDSTIAVTGMTLAKELASSVTNARKYDDALRSAASHDGSDRMADKMDELFYLLSYGPNGPYGLQSAAKEIGLSIDTTVQVFKKLLGTGLLKGVSASRTTRIRGDIADFGNLFKFNKGGIVPGTGNEDTVLSWLTPGELVVPKNVVSSLFQGTQPSATFANSAAGANFSKAAIGNNGGGVTYQFNTTIHNPIAEESSKSVQKRVRNLANLGVLG